MVELTANRSILDLDPTPKHIREVISKVCKEYRDAITDWCHHSLAIEVAAKNTGQSLVTVEKLVALYYTGPRPAGIPGV